ncbi:MAG: right-handed parallel beta-helix repeat-containing protein [Lachnospiraceae bacterium]|nr:right-handed parallel beta-helix repeat-containing protein [Lachnospiraceae bacterium]
MTQLKKRLTSIAMVLLMVISMLPMGGTVIRAMADETTKVFDATTLDGTGVADKDAIAEGTTYADGFFKVVGTVTQRTKDDGTIKSVEVAKAAKGAIQFTTFGISDVVIEMSSTGGSNTSVVALVNTADGSAVAEDTGITLVTGTDRTTLKYTSLPAGTYQVVTPESEEYGRNARLYTITVKELPVAAAAAETVEYVFDATTLDVVADKHVYEEGTVFADYFKVIGEVTQRTNGDGTAVKSVEVKKAAQGSLTFTVTGTADVTLNMGSTGGSNTSAVALVDAAGNVIANNEGISLVETTAQTTMTYTGLAAGTYSVITPDNPDYARNARVFSIKVVETTGGAATTEYVFDPTTFAVVGDKEAYEEGTVFADYFKVVGTVTQRTNSDGTAVKSVEVAKAVKGAISFTVNGTADVTLEMGSTGGSNTSAVALLDENDNVVANNEGISLVETTAATVMTYTGLPAGTYRVVTPDNPDYARNARVFKIVVVQTSSGERPARAAWDSVAAPEITKAVAEGGSIKVSYKMVIGYDGADKITVEMLDAAGNVVASESAASDGTEGTVSFSPEVTGDYTFRITAVRAEEADKVATSAATAFVLPLKTPACTSATSEGNGKVSVVWAPVDETESYLVSYHEAGSDAIVQAGTTTETEFVVEGLTVDTEYVFMVQAVRGEEITEAGTIEGKATKEKQRVWSFSAFGSSTNTKDNWYEGNANDGTVTVASLNGKGKIVPNSTDGIAFYYTTIDPETENFKLSATIHVDEWTISNGQDGFGMMVADAVGEHGDSGTFWNNYFSAVVSKVEYWYDPETDSLVTHGTGTGNKISMKLGVGSQQKIGVTAANIADGTISTNINELFDARTTTFETSQKLMPGTNTFNIVGNATNNPEGTLPEKALLTEFDFTIERNNTGYFISYDDPKTGETVTHKYYDIERTALTQIDPENIYVGFYASRNAKITVTNISLTTSDPATDAPAEGRELSYVPVVCDVISASATGNEDYKLTIYTNAEGTLTVKDGSGNVIAENLATNADDYTYIDTKLAVGQTIFKINFVPNADFKFGEYEVLASYDPVDVTLSVMRRTFDGDIIYVAPEVDPSSTGKGTKESPTDINTAVKYVRPGQVILLEGGRYWEFLKTITVERGNDGTAEQPIYLMADPEATERPVLDFEYNEGKGITIAGNYWILDGFDITNTADGQKGLVIAGSNCVVQNINAYNNGNTGIQISRYKSTDYWEDWPANNLILNCTSCNNADHGYEDADGFAAKLTVADGNVFDGCVAYNNADDGWDLFAKIETGSIGVVTIKNSIAYGNGYLVDGTNAGNGNGFKLGGDSMAGAHILENCVAFNNKAKGIDSNSGPDVQVHNCTSFNNGSYNVALYTNNAADTAYVVDGVISFRTEVMEQAEQLKLKGTQDETKVYGANNYFYNAETQTSVNNAGEAMDASWFVTTDTTTAWTRNEDGTINMNGLFVLSDAAPENTGAVIGGTANTDYSGIVKELQAKEAEAKPTAAPTAAADNNASGNNASGNNTSEPASSTTNVGMIVVIVIAVVAVAGVAVAAMMAKKKKGGNK